MKMPRGSTAIAAAFVYAVTEKKYTVSEVRALCEFIVKHIEDNTVVIGGSAKTTT